MSPFPKYKVLRLQVLHALRNRTEKNQSSNYSSSHPITTIWHNVNFSYACEYDAVYKQVETRTTSHHCWWHTYVPLDTCTG